MRRVAWDPGHVLERESEEGLAVKEEGGVCGQGRAKGPDERAPQCTWRTRFFEKETNSSRDERPWRQEGRRQGETVAVLAIGMRGRREGQKEESAPHLGDIVDRVENKTPR
jgi:hypothetical protein